MGSCCLASEWTESKEVLEVENHRTRSYVEIQECDSHLTSAFATNDSLGDVEFKDVLQ